MKFIFQKTICSCRVISIFMKFDKSSQQAETSGVWSVYNLKPESSSSKQFPSVCLVCGVGCHCSAEEGLLNNYSPTVNIKINNFQRISRNMRWCTAQRKLSCFKIICSYEFACLGN